MTNNYINRTTTVEKPYIYTKDNHWFLEWYTSLEEAEQNAPEGYTVDLFITTKQIP